jgi:transposase
MQPVKHYIGIDIASASFTVAVGQMTSAGWRITGQPQTFANSYDSFPQLLSWLQEQQVRANDAVVCMEATGVYNEVLAHFLVTQHYAVVIAPPLSVKRAFKPAGHKTDPVDSCQISEYAYRFIDELRPWQPRAEVLEQISTLLTTRSLLVTQSTGHRNALHALTRKKVRTPLAEQIHQTALEQLKQQIAQLEAEIRRLIDQDPTFRELIGLLMSIPGVGLLLASHLLVLFQSSQLPPNPKQLAAYIGICPYQESSGTSLFHRPTSRHYGPPTLRKLLHLAAMSLRQHNADFRHYFLRKQAEGKPDALILNNIANRLLKIICAVYCSRKRFIPNYKSVSPVLLH